MAECTVNHMPEIQQLKRELEAWEKRTVAAREHMQRLIVESLQNLDKLEDWRVLVKTRKAEDNDDDL